MAPTRSLVLGALCALAIPAASFADAPGTHDNGATATGSTGAACNCDQVCAQREQARLNARTEARRRAAMRARRHRANTVATTMHIDTRIQRSVAAGCEYQATAQGSYRSNDPTGVRGENVQLRNLDVRADASLSCAGQPVRRTSQRWVFPTTTPRQLEDLMHQRLALEVPGSQCQWSSAYEMHGGNLVANGVEGNCSRGQGLAAVEGYGRTGANASAMGGGPRVMTRGQRYRHDGNMIEGIGPYGNASRTGGNVPSSRDARVGTH